MDKKKFEEMSKDPSFTMEVKNPEVEEMLVEYSKDKSAENLNKLINKIHDSKGNTIIDANYSDMIQIPDKTKAVFVCTYDVNYNDDT